MVRSKYPYYESKYEQPYSDNMRQTRPMAILLHTHKGIKSYQANLDAEFNANYWKQRYEKEGFRDPQTGETFMPHELRSVQVREVGVLAQWASNPITAEGSLAWLYEQVEEICALATP